MKQINLTPIHKDSLSSVGCGAFPNSTTTCFDCSTSTTSLWRRDSMGNSVCNACRLYFLHHNKKRPASSVPHVIRRRNRKKSNRTLPKLQSPSKLAPISWYRNHSECLPSIENIHTLSHQPCSISPELKDQFSNPFGSVTSLIDCQPIDSLPFDYSKQLQLSSPTSEFVPNHYSQSFDSQSAAVNLFAFDSGISYSCLQASLALLDLANFPVSTSPSTMAPPPSPR